jgi:microsomal dipeptidase-like Zn-dependent dipeptidase
MNRREFLAKLMRYGISAGALSALPVEQLFAQEIDPRFTIPIIDPHAHLPGNYSLINHQVEYTWDVIQSAKLCATTMAVIGDDRSIENADLIWKYNRAIEGLNKVLQWEDDNLIKIVRRPSDIPPQPDPTGPIPVILAIEGGDAITMDLDVLDKFYSMGVRMITIVHGTADPTRGRGDNQIGNDMRRHSSSDPNDDGLTEFGYQVVRRMNRLGMVVDVSHASTQTLFDVASCTCAPIIDSHTSMLPPHVTERIAGRQRLYREAKAIVKTGGVVCTYPIKDNSPLPPPYNSELNDRLNLNDWVDEIVQFKSHFGIRHIGFGTDSGGGLPGFVDGWSDITSVGALEDVMRSRGLGTLAIAAFTGLNFLRVFARCHAVGQVLSFLKS